MIKYRGTILLLTPSAANIPPSTRVLRIHLTQAVWSSGISEWESV